MIETLGGGEVLALALATLALGGLTAVLFAIMLLYRRRVARETRELVLAVEEMRSGTTERLGDSSPDAPLSAVYDALARLNQDLGVRATRSEQAERRLAAVSEAIRDTAIVTVDDEGEIRAFSAGAASLFGWDESEVLARPLSLLFEPDAWREFLPKLSRRSLREHGLDARAVMHRQDGVAFTAGLTVSALQDGAGQSNGFVLVVRDATASEKLKSELRESEQRYRQLVDGLGDGVAILVGGCLRYVNPAFADLCGLPGERLVGSPLRERIATRDVLTVEEGLARLAAVPGGGERFHCGWIDAHGRRRRSVELTARSVEHGGEAAVLLLVRDETVERRIEAELRRNESQLDAVLEAGNDGILMLADTPDGAVVQVMNRAFGARFELDAARLLGGSEERLLQALRDGVEGGAALAGFLVESRVEARRKPLRVGGSRPADLEVSCSPLRDRAGRALGRVVICRDRTEQRAAESKLQLRAEKLQLSKVMLEQSYRKLDLVNQRLAERSAELDRLNGELRTLDRMKTQLLGNVSHELQTPLVSIRGYTEMILKERLGPITEEQRRGLGLCLKNIDRLITMIDNLLVFSRDEPRLGEMSLTEFPLAPLIDEVAQLLRDKLEARGIGLSVSVDPGAAPARVHADRDKVQQVFINLLSNAVKFNRDGGSIAVRVRPGTRDRLEIEVEDSGVGISREDRERIFDRHYQVREGDAPKPQGSGIGLSIVRDILRVHGGSIEVDSEPGRFTRFRFSLPRKAGREAGPEDAPGTSAEHDATSPARPDDDEPRPRFRVIRRQKGS